MTYNHSTALQPFDRSTTIRPSYDHSTALRLVDVRPLYDRSTTYNENCDVLLYSSR